MKPTLFRPHDIAQRVSLTPATVRTFLRLTNPVHPAATWHRLDQAQFDQAVAQLERLKAQQPAHPLRALKSK